MNTAGNVDEAGLRLALLSATWPQDMVRIADAYMNRFAEQPWAAHAERIRQGAEITARLVRRDDVQLFRSSFAQATQRGFAADDLRQAALGEAAAALRLARQAERAGGVGSSPVGWLQLAAELGSEQAASHYDRKAQALGHLSLPSLDHLRK